MTDAKIIHVDFKNRCKVSAVSSSSLLNEDVLRASGFDDRTIANVMTLAAPIPTKTTVFDTYDHYKGSSYEDTKNLSCKDIAKLIRVQLKKFSGFKFGITTDYNHIRVRITAMPANTALYNPEWVAFNKANPHEHNSFQRYSADVARTLAAIEVLVSEYNKIDSDKFTDYYAPKFYGNVSVDYEFAKSRQSERD